MVSIQAFFFADYIDFDGALQVASTRPMVTKAEPQLLQGPTSTPN